MNRWLSEVQYFLKTMRKSIIRDFNFFSSIRIARVNFLIIYWVENFQKTLDLLSSIATHAIDDYEMNDTFQMNISIFLDARQRTQTHIKQNFNEDFDFSRRDVVSWSWMMNDLNFLQTDLDIDVFDHDFKKNETNK
jgi:hypothetical protein